MEKIKDLLMTVFIVYSDVIGRVDIHRVEMPGNIKTKRIVFIFVE
jgi:hypothetical protein